MAILNPSFEDAGAHPGVAEHWNLVTVTSRERIAGFGSAPHEAWENFERWFELRLGLGPGDVALALFDPLAEGHEDFEEAWNNDLYLEELPTGQIITAPFGGGAVEDMEDGWSNVPYRRAWDEVTEIVGTFDGEPREDFEEQWRANEAFASSWASVTSATAIFDGGAEPDEDFENGWAPATSI